MATLSAPASAAYPFGAPVPVVCPTCRSVLDAGVTEIRCRACQSAFAYSHGVPDLIVGGRYDDPTPEWAIRNEEESLRETTARYWLPLFRGLLSFPETTAPTVLSLGCGTGTDVELLAENGFNAVGIDCGKRAAEWSARRRWPRRYLMANGKHMPFPDAIFDAVFCGCVFPHVGVQGVTYRVTPDYQEQRDELAREMARVLKPGGKIVTCNPNRWFPFDIFHEHTAEKFVLRPTPPWARLLLSRGDYERMFRRAGCRRTTALPVENYWGFTHSRKTLKGRIFSAPVRLLFWLASRDMLKPLRSSCLNPWLIVLIEKDPAPASV
jgi:SAM-dependent methyltransferase